MVTAVFSKPWTIMETVYGYNVGDAFNLFNLDVNDRNFYLNKSMHILGGLYNVKQYTNLRVALTIGTLSAISIFIIRKKEEDVINYTGNILSIAVLGFVILQGKNRPHRAFVACFSAAINLLVAYNKLPDPIKKVWSVTPFVRSSITLYASDDMWDKAIAAQDIYQFGQPYFSPPNNNGEG